TVTINASNTAVMVQNGGIATVSGGNDQIAQMGPTKLTLTSGTGDVIYVESGTLLTGHPYLNSYPITSASSASITIGSGVGTAAAPALVYGNNDIVSVGANSFVTVSGTGNVIDLSSGGTALIRGTASGGLVPNGGTLQVSSGATASNTTVLSG